MLENLQLRFSSSLLRLASSMCFTRRFTRNIFRVRRHVGKSNLIGPSPILVPQLTPDTQCPGQELPQLIDKGIHDPLVLRHTTPNTIELESRLAVLSGVRREKGVLPCNRLLPKRYQNISSRRLFGKSGHVGRSPTHRQVPIAV